jgi:glycosyltransferase involved in cell wall biosynthesis
VASVLAQSYSNIELIIVDDASSDETSEYLTELTNAHKNIRFFTQETSKGACAARNIAINDAKGELITGLDDDDEFLPERIADLVANYDENYAFVCTGFLWNYGKRSRQVDHTNKIINLGEQLNYNYSTNQVLVATERLKAIGGFDETFVACQDYDTWTRLIIKFGVAKRVAGASYVIHRSDDIKRLTEPTNWLKGNRQFMAKHAKLLSVKNIKNQEFRIITVQRKRYALITFLKQITAGLLKDKVRYLISSNFTLVGKIRRHFLEQ